MAKFARGSLWLGAAALIGMLGCQPQPGTGPTNGGSGGSGNSGGSGGGGGGSGGSAAGGSGGAGGGSSTGGSGGSGGSAAGSGGSAAGSGGSGGSGGSAAAAAVARPARPGDAAVERPPSGDASVGRGGAGGGGQRRLRQAQRRRHVHDHGRRGPDAVPGGAADELRSDEALPAGVLPARPGQQHRGAGQPDPRRGGRQPGHRRLSEVLRQQRLGGSRARSPGGEHRPAAGADQAHERHSTAWTPGRSS